jgi:hypothetical protein
LSIALPLVVGVALGLALLSARPAHALVSGGCTAKATASVSGPIDLTTERVWHLRNEDVVNGEGHPASGTKLKGVTVRVDSFGMSIPIYFNNDEGTGGTAGPYSVSTYSKLIRILAASGEAGGGACTGSIKIILDDASPVANVSSGLGLLLAVVGLILMLRAVFGRGGFGSRLGGAFGGLVCGLGAGLLLQQTGTLEPTSLLGLAFPALGLIVGAMVGGAMGRGRGRVRA